MGYGYSVPRLLDGTFYYGRLCRNCGMELSRPANVRQSGMNMAVVCDTCWAGALFQWKRQQVSAREIARTFGVNEQAVSAKLAYAGLGHESVKENRRRNFRGVRGRRLPRE